MLVYTAPLHLAPDSTHPHEVEKGAALAPRLSQTGQWLPRATEKPVSTKGPWCHCQLGSEDLKRSHSLSHILQSQRM